ncbi:hypothetical protein J7T55_000738 [Diaporthe amygdali]|uniref:uncharacterized protein n=1 Tax=Phomopsis amygdali TaxID=1214568 RepID=UPI0022FEFF7B|nr:uncharacterized protein J7T55_000738 [Diaporthe amygdali]KAJ0110305.1 hypothetical protein J7T55_000738 [Diaporthe amygdali]
MSQHLGDQKAQPHSRNRSPCKACQAAKRKCDQIKPKCSRCRKQNLVCEPSAQSRWRINTLSDVPINRAASRLRSAQARPSLERSRQRGAGESGGPLQADSVQIGSVENHSSVTSTTPDKVPDTVGSHEAEETGDSTSELLSIHHLDSLPQLACPDFVELLNHFPWNGTLMGADQFLQGLEVQWQDCMSSTTPGKDIQATDDVGQHPQDVENEASAPDNCFDPIFQPSTQGCSALDAAIDELLGGVTQSTASISSHRTYMMVLWENFLQKIAPSLTPFGTRDDNPFLKYLVPNAESNSSLLIAVLYLAQAFSRRNHRDFDPAIEDYLERKAEEVLQTLEQDNALTLDVVRESGEQTSKLVLTLSTVLVFCMTFIAKHDASRFHTHMELAVILCQFLFRTLAEDESFLYLAKLLGFMHNALLFSTSASSANAPDFLGAALELQSRDTGTLCDIDGYLEKDIHFHDLDVFSGMSSAIANILYTLGMLLKRKQIDLGATPLHEREAARMFECDIDGLEMRLRRHMAQLKKCRELRNISELSYDDSLARSLNFYNEAVFWSAWTIFLTDLKNMFWADVGVQESRLGVLVMLLKSDATSSSLSDDTFAGSA